MLLLVSIGSGVELKERLTRELEIALFDTGAEVDFFRKVTRGK